jgi:hypothetical protein
MKRTTEANYNTDSSAGVVDINAENVSHLQTLSHAGAKQRLVAFTTDLHAFL